MCSNYVMNAIKEVKCLLEDGHLVKCFPRTVFFFLPVLPPCCAAFEGLLCSSGLHYHITHVISLMTPSIYEECVKRTSNVFTFRLLQCFVNSDFLPDGLVVDDAPLDVV